MGIELRLIPLDDRREVILKATGFIQPATVFVFGKNVDSIAEQLHQIKNRPKPRIVPERFAPYHSLSWMGQHLTTDPCWHEPLSFVCAEQLKGLEVRDDPRDVEIMATIAEMRPEARILIWWTGTSDPPVEIAEAAAVA